MIIIILSNYIKYEIILSLEYDSSLTLSGISMFAPFSRSTFTPLYVAAYEGHVECVRVLLEKGANIDSQNRVSEESYSSDCIISYLI